MCGHGCTGQSSGLQNMRLRAMTRAQRDDSHLCASAPVFLKRAQPSGIGSISDTPRRRKVSGISVVSWHYTSHATDCYGLRVNRVVCTPLEQLATSGSVTDSSTCNNLIWRSCEFCTGDCGRAFTHVGLPNRLEALVTLGCR